LVKLTTIISFLTSSVHLGLALVLVALLTPIISLLPKGTLFGLHYTCQDHSQDSPSTLYPMGTISNFL